jgi:hypothetical protein
MSDNNYKKFDDQFGLFTATYLQKILEEYITQHKFTASENETLLKISKEIKKQVNDHCYCAGFCTTFNEKIIKHLEDLGYSVNYDGLTTTISWEKEDKPTINDAIFKIKEDIKVAEKHLAELKKDLTIARGKCPHTRTEKWINDDGDGQFTVERCLDCGKQEDGGLKK